MFLMVSVSLWRCTPCRQRRGKAFPSSHTLIIHQMHPVQAAPRQRTMPTVGYRRLCDAPRAGSAEAKLARLRKRRPRRDAPRAGSAEAKAFGQQEQCAVAQMHPVQAAPRQRYSSRYIFSHRQDAPRAGSAEAKPSFPTSALKVLDAPRAGSAEAKKQDSTIIDGFRDAPRAGSAEAK